MKLLSLAACAVSLIAAPALATDYSGTGGALPDRVNFSSSINVTDSFSVSDVNATLNGLSHSFWGDLDISLTHGAVTVFLTNDNGGGSDPAGDFTFDDSALTSVSAINATGGSFIPLQSLSAFDGMDSFGLWTLNIVDDANLDSGALRGWTLSLDGAPGAVPEPANWAMMLTGFGLVGGAMRTRARKTVATA